VETVREIEQERDRDDHDELEHGTGHTSFGVAVFTGSPPDGDRFFTSRLRDPPGAGIALSG
jgi:hypothetical protein